MKKGALFGYIATGVTALALAGSYAFSQERPRENQVLEDIVGLVSQAAPAPDAGKKGIEDIVKEVWPKPGPVVNGLQVTIKTDRQEYKSGDSIDIKLKFENTGKKDIDLYSMANYIRLSFQVEGQDGQVRDFKPSADFKLAETKDSFHVIKPGEKFISDYLLNVNTKANTPYVDKGKNVKGKKKQTPDTTAAHEDLYLNFSSLSECKLGPAGNYKITLGYKASQDSIKAIAKKLEITDYWNSSLSSNSVSVMIKK